MEYRFCGKSGLQLPLISLGMWHNFGDVDNFSTAQEIVFHAFEQGITHFDLANNYGPPPGSAEANFGKILSHGLKSHRDEIVVSSKAGHLMWDGPYGDGGSRKYIMASINQSLKRTELEYFDIFLQPPLLPGDTAGGDRTGSYRHREAGEGPLYRVVEVSGGQSCGSLRHDGRPAHPLPDLPRPLQHALPQARAGAFPPYRQMRNGLHRVLAVSSGTAYQPLHQRHTG